MKKIIILSIILLPLLTGCYNYRELNNLSIVTAISIEKNNDLYKYNIDNFYKDKIIKFLPLRPSPW